MSSDAILSLVLKTNKARSLNDLDSYLHLRRQLVRELNKIQDEFNERYKISEATYYRHLGREMGRRFQ